MSAWRPLRRACAAVMAIGVAASIAQPPEKVPGVITAYSGHSETVYGVALSPDGKQLLTASFDKAVKLWDVASGKELRTFGGPQGHQNLVLGVAFAPDGRTFASCSSDNTVKIWDAPQSKPQRELTCGDAATAIAQSQDGKSMAAGSRDGTIKLWNTPDAKESFRLTGHVGPVTGLTYSPNGQMLLSCGTDHTFRLWSPSTGHATSTIVAHGSAINAVGVAPNGNTAVTAGADGLLKLWQLPPVAGKSLVHPQPIQMFAVNSDGSRSATAGNDKQVRIWNSDTGKEENTYAAAAPVTALVLPGEAASLVVALDNKTLVTVNGKEFKKLADLPSPARAVVTSTNRKTIVVGLDEGSIRFYDAAKGAEAKKLPGHPGGVTALRYHSNGNLLSSAGKDKTVKLWDTASGKEVRTVATLTSPANALAVSNDGSQVAAAVGKEAKLFSTEGKELAALPHPAEVIALAWNSDHTKLVTGTTDNLARVWDLAPPPPGKPIEMQAFSHGAAVVGVAFHPTKPTVVFSASADKTVAVNTLTTQRAIRVSDAPIRALAVHPNGQSVVTACDDKSVKAWNLGTGNAERTFAGAGGAVLALAVSRNGNLVATAGADKTIRLYTFADGNLVGSFPAPAVVRSLSFDPSGFVLLSSGEDKAVTGWNVAFQAGNPLPPEFGKSVQSLSHPAVVPAASYSADGKTVISACEDKMARVWTIAGEGPIKSLAHQSLVDAIAYNKDGSLLASACHDGTVRIWDTVKGTQVRQINAHTQPQAQPVYTVAWSPDNKQVATGSLDKSIKIWDAATGNAVREIKGFDEKTSPNGHRDGVFTVAWSPDGQSLVSGSSDHSIRIWKAADGSFVRDLVNPNVPSSAGFPSQAHPGWICQIRFRPNGTLVSVGEAPRNHGYIAVWSIADGRLLGSADLPLGFIYSVAVSHSDDALALACGPRGRQTPQADAVLLKTPGNK